MPMTEREALAAIEREYKFAVGIHPRESAGVLYGPDSAPVRVDIQALANSMWDREIAAERYINFVRPTIQNPYEIWLTEVVTSDNRTVLARAYIGLYADRSGKREAFVVYAERLEQMWSMHHFQPVREGEIDKYRCGVELIYTRPA